MKKIFMIISLICVLYTDAFSEKKIKARFEKIAKDFTGNINVKIKPEIIKVQGMKTRASMKIQKKYKGNKGEMSLVIGSPENAFKGQTFYQVVSDFSTCIDAKETWDDCNNTGGSHRTEMRDSKEWTIKDKEEKWIHWAVKPIKNMMDPYRRKYVGQCHPSSDGPKQSIGITFLNTFKGSKLWMNLQLAAVYDPDKGYLWHTPSRDTWKYDLKDFTGKITPELGVNEWTSILVHVIHRNDEKGLFEVFVDGNDKPAFKHIGPIWHKPKGKRKLNKCFFKLGVYIDNNKYVLRSDIQEEAGRDLSKDSVVWIDAVAIGKTREKVLELVEKDR